MSPERAVAEQLKAFEAVERIVLFGSRARVDHGPRADIDLAVECPGADPICWADMVEAAEAAPTLLKIDLVRMDRAPAELLAAIQAEGVVLYERSKRQPTTA